MAYRVAADLVMVLHFLFVVFVLLGGIAVWRWFWVAWLHVPAFAWGVLVAVNRWICPLTPLEQRLRAAAGDEGYQGGFIAHYIEPLIYPEGVGYEFKMFFAGMLAILNVALYWHAWRRRKLHLI